MSDDTNRRYWTPVWEVRDKYPGTLPPCEIRPWSFRASSGKLVDLQCKYQQTPNPMDAQRPIKWSRVAGDKPLNPHNNITLTWEQAQRVVALSREKDLPLNKCVAAVINLDDYSKNQLAEIAQSPAVWASSRSSPGTVKKSAEYDATTEAFFKEARASVETPKPAAAPAAKAATAANAPKVAAVGSAAT